MNKKRFYGLSLLIPSLFLSLLCVEAFSGYLYRNLPEKYNNGKRIVDYYLGVNSPIQSSKEPHPYLLYQNSKNYYAERFLQHNSLGYRNKEFDIKKKKGLTRILALGVSTTYMFPYVKNPENTWVSQLECMLSSSLQCDIQVINAGLPYATTAELLSSYIFHHQYLYPDILIIHTGGNDVAPLLFDKYDPE